MRAAWRLLTARSYRVYRKRDANRALNAAKTKASVSGYGATDPLQARTDPTDLESATLAVKFFWPRLIATTLGWVRMASCAPR